MRALGIKKKRAFYDAQVEKTLEVLVEGASDEATGWRSGRSSNYVPVFLKNYSGNENNIVPAIIETRLGDRGVIASAILCPAGS